MKILITGGTGSLGNALIPHFLKKGHKIRVLSRDELKQSKMKVKYPSVDFMLGDVRDGESCQQAIYGMDAVIHAAALKRIERGEEQPRESILTNLHGTDMMVRYSKLAGIKKFVFISSDKACKPINVYGICKALAEKIVTRVGYNCVRYGNVNSSRGSVLPIWREQIKQGKPLTITNPNMTRFLIDFPQAIKLIETAMKKMDGLIYVPKLERTDVLSLVSTITSDPKYPIKLIGERPSEKLHEELINEDEFRGRVEERDKYFIIHREKKFKPQHREYTSEVGL